MFLANIKFGHILCVHPTQSLALALSNNDKTSNRRHPHISGDPDLVSFSLDPRFHGDGGLCCFTLAHTDNFCVRRIMYFLTSRIQLFQVDDALGNVFEDRARGEAAPRSGATLPVTDLIQHHQDEILGTIRGKKAAE